MLFWVNFNSCYWKLEQHCHCIKCLCIHSNRIIYLCDHKKMTLSILVGLYKNYLIAACFTFCKFRNRTLTPSRFKNLSNNTFKLLGHNFNHQEGFIKQKNFTLHCPTFNINFPKHLNWLYVLVMSPQERDKNIQSEDMMLAISYLSVGCKNFVLSLSFEK